MHLKNPLPLALDGFDLNTVHELSSNEKISRPRFEPRAAGCKARMLSIVLRAPTFFHLILKRENKIERLSFF